MTHPRPVFARRPDSSGRRSNLGGGDGDCQPPLPGLAMAALIDGREDHRYNKLMYYNGDTRGVKS